MIQGIKLDLEIVGRDNYVPGTYVDINGHNFCHFKKIKFGDFEAYSVLRLFVVHFSPVQFPELLEHALIETAGYSWPNSLTNYPHGFTKGPCELYIYDDEYEGGPFRLRRNQVYVMVASYDDNSEEVIPLLHFYQVLLLLSEKILELARQYGTMAYYQKNDPERYNPNWDQEMVRLIGLLRERIAVESERTD